VNDARTKVKGTNALNFHRSAMAPVGMMAIVSMKTILKQDSAATGAVYTSGDRKNPCVPKRPNSLPKTFTTNSL